MPPLRAYVIRAMDTCQASNVFPPLAYPCFRPHHITMKKKIIVIGGGIAGLNAGIELLQHGYDVSLYEKNKDVGGLCYGYQIDGYSIDACFHWLMGTKPYTTIHNLWVNNGALNEDVPVSHLPYFCTFIHNGVTVTFSRDIDEEEKRWKKLSPKDEKTISSFFGCVKSLAYVWELTQDESAPAPSMDVLRSLPNATKIFQAMRLSREDYAKKFTHPALRFAIKNAMTGYNNAFFFMQVYGLFSSGDGDVPLGGAYPFVQRIKDKFLSLGGELHLNTQVDELVPEKGSIVCARIGEEKITGDYFIAALDPHVTLSKLLQGKYRSRTFSYLDKHISSYTVSGCYCAYVKVKDYQDDIATPTCRPIPKTKIGKKGVHALLIRPYAFDTLASKDDAAVISLFVDQDQEDYEYFSGLKEYPKEKGRIDKALINAFLDLYPQYKGKTEILTSFGPLELQQQTFTSYGSIQSYSLTEKGMFYSIRGKVHGIDNLYMCGQWNRSIGGTPTALLTSHEIVNKLLHREKWLSLNPLKK